MNVSHKLKLIWWAPARNATRALSEILCHYDFYNYMTTPPVSLKETAHTHVCGIPEELKEYDVLLQVRNPYSRIVSSWHLSCFTTTNNTDLVLTTTFEDYVKSKVFGFGDHYETCYLLKHPKYIIRYENLKEDVTALPFLDLTNINVKIAYDRHIVNNGYMTEGPSNDSGNLKRGKNVNYADWQSYYTQELADIVYKEYAEQFKLFGYERDSWKL